MNERPPIEIILSGIYTNEDVKALAEYAKRSGSLFLVADQLKKIKEPLKPGVLGGAALIPRGGDP